MSNRSAQFLTLSARFRAAFVAGYFLAGLANPAAAGLAAYVTNNGGNTVSVIRLADHQVIDSYTVGTAPVGIAADATNGRLYVANSASASVTRITLATEQTNTLSIPGSEPEGIAVSPDGSIIVVTSLERVVVGPGSMSRVYFVDGSTFTVMASVLVDDDPEGVTISADGDNAWWASDIRIREADLTTPPVFTPLGVLDGILNTDDYEEIAVLANESILFATNELRNRVDVVDLSTELIVATPATGSNPEDVVLRPGANQIHVSNQLGNSVTVISSAAPYAPIGTFALGQNEPRGIAFTPDGATGYVACAASNSVVRYDAAARMVVGTPIAVGANPEEIAILDAPIAPPPAGAREWRFYE